MRKNILLLLLTLLSFSAIHAEDNIKWTLSDDGTLTISGTGNMPDILINVNNRTTAPWDSQRDKIKTVVIKDGVTNIGSFAFYECKNLTSVEIPNSVTSIGDDAFSYCENLASIEIPNSVTSIGDYAFEQCYGLTSVTIPNSVTSIGDWAFYFCSSLTSVKIPSSVTSIGDRVFLYCKNLTSVEIPNSITSIGDRAFCNCENLTSAIIPNSVTSIGESVFSGCDALTSVTIPNSITSIGEYFFYGCRHLTSIEIPNSVTSIGQKAFYNCKALTSITFKRSTPPEFGGNVFDYVDKSIPVYVPANSREAYKDVLSGFGMSNIKAIPLSLNGSESYTQNSQIDDIDVSFTRNFTKYWEPLYIPFSLKYEDWKDDFEVARINGIHQYDDNDDGNIDRTILEFVKLNSGSTAPNTPYIIRAKKKGEKTFYVENTTVYPAEKNTVDCSTTAANFIFTGTYIPARFLASRPYYTLSGGKLERLDGLNGPSVPPYHWYMKIESRNSGYAKYYNPAKEITISVLGEEEATGVEELRIMNYELPDDKLPVYDLNGRKVNENSLKPGIYVKNGKKFVIK